MRRPAAEKRRAVAAIHAIISFMQDDVNQGSCRQRQRWQAVLRNVVEER